MKEAAYRRRPEAGYPTLRAERPDCRGRASQPLPCPRSTAPPRCTSGASRRGRTVATAYRQRLPTATSWARSGSGTARTFATPSRRRTRHGVGEGDGAQPRPGPLLSGGEPRRAADEFGPAAGADGRADEGRTRGRASIERLFTYAAWADKWDGAVHRTPVPQRHPGHARAGGRDGGGVPGRAPLLGFISTVMPPWRGQLGWSRCRRSAGRCWRPICTRCSRPRRAGRRGSTS